MTVVFTPERRRDVPAADRSPPCTVDGLTDRLEGASRPDPLRRGRHGRRQAVLHRRAVPGLLRREGLPAARGGAADGRRPRPCRSRWSAARSCASPTASPCRAATSTCRPTQRAAAAVLHRALRAGAALVRAGRARRRRPWRPAWREVVAAEPLAELDYAEVVDPDTLEPPGRLEPGRSVRLLVAAGLGQTRLLDNLGGSRALRPRLVPVRRPARRQALEEHDVHRRMMKSKIHRARSPTPISTTSGRSPSTPA